MSEQDKATSGRGAVTARQAAHAMMVEVIGEGRRLSDVSEGILAALPPAERARAARLAAEALRFAPRADRVLGPYLRNLPSPEPMAALRLGVWEMLGDGAPAHGVVDAMAGAVRKGPGGRSQAGLVNAVLRKVAAAGPDWDALPVPAMPKALRKRVVAAWGKEAAAEIEAAHAAGAPLDLTPRDGDGAALAAATGGTALPTGSVRIAGRPQVSKLPGYAEGRFWVQDAAAALPARMLAVRPGERVLDLCAAPGGKTMQLAAAGASVTALDISGRRLERVRENLSRTGLSAEIVEADALAWVPDEGFDAILLDAPCSATGTIRRHPDLPFVFDPADAGELVALQTGLAERALGWLKPGGRMVYATCSILPEEGEGVLGSLLARHPELRVARRVPEGVPEAWITEAGALRTRPDMWPEYGGLDGFFTVCLHRLEPADATG